MRLNNAEASSTQHVHNCGNLARTLRILMGAVLALCLGLSLTVPGSRAWADDTGGTGQQTTQDGQGGTGDTQSGQQITINDSIIDTGNLLGPKLSEVMDSINKVKQSTGATLRLMYLPHLDTQGDPEAWCRQVLDTSGAAPNTVLLAVASQDGSLVSCVSSGSDDWLNKNVQSFADAALKPITSNDDPDWGGAAIALADKIVESKETTASRTMVFVGVGAAGAVLALLVILGLVFMRRKKRRRRHAGERARGKAKDRGRSRGGRHGADDLPGRADADAVDGVLSPEAGVDDGAAGADSTTVADDGPATAASETSGAASFDAAASTGGHDGTDDADAAMRGTAEPAEASPEAAAEDDPLAKYRS